MTLNNLVAIRNSAEEIIEYSCEMTYGDQKYADHIIGRYGADVTGLSIRASQMASDALCLSSPKDKDDTLPVLYGELLDEIVRDLSGKFPRTDIRRFWGRLHALQPHHMFESGSASCTGWLISRMLMSQLSISRERPSKLPSLGGVWIPDKDVGLPMAYRPRLLSDLEYMCRCASDIIKKSDGPAQKEENISKYFSSGVYDEIAKIWGSEDSPDRLFEVEKLDYATEAACEMMSDIYPITDIIYDLIKKIKANKKGKEKYITAVGLATYMWASMSGYCVDSDCMRTVYSSFLHDEGYELAGPIAIREMLLYLGEIRSGKIHRAMYMKWKELSEGIRAGSGGNRSLDPYDRRMEEMYGCHSQIGFGGGCMYKGRYHKFGIPIAIPEEKQISVLGHSDLPECELSSIISIPSPRRELDILRKCGVEVRIRRGSQ